MSSYTLEIDEKDGLAKDFLKFLKGYAKANPYLKLSKQSEKTILYDYEQEDDALANAVNEGKTGEYINTNDFINKL